VNADKAINTIGKVRKLQRKLYLAAKLNRKRKFHALYDKVFREDILQEAWKRVKNNGGAEGIDGISIQAVEEYGTEKFLEEIQQQLICGEYRPQPVRRVEIPKPDGSKRPLGIPTIKDRIVQTATKIVIEPIFEANFKDNSYGFRPKKRAHQALEEVRKACNQDGWWVVDADIKEYFDSINHEKLMKLVEMRINDRRILKLVKQWLKAGVMKDGKRENSNVGSPQGGVISPLLSNIYLHCLDLLWEKQGRNFGKLVRYADDFVVICRTRQKAGYALQLIKAIMEKLDLKLNPDKTKLVSMLGGEEGFDFLGMHHRRIKAQTKKGKTYYSTYQFPCRKAMQKMRDAVNLVLAPRAVLILDVKTLIEKLNPKIRGWRNYYGVDTATKWLRSIDWHITLRLTRWWNKKRQRKRHLFGILDVRQMFWKLGLIKLVTFAE